jgi:N6-L-threonylcarbamoyladenine synthase
VEDNKITNKADAASSFQAAIVEVLVGKTIAVAQQYQAKQIMLAGGVSANKHLRQKMTADSPLPVLIPPIALCTDNAAMIAACGYFRFQDGKISDLSLDVIPGLKLV